MTHPTLNAKQITTQAVDNARKGDLKQLHDVVNLLSVQGFCRGGGGRKRLRLNYNEMFTFFRSHTGVDAGEFEELMQEVDHYASHA